MSPIAKASVKYILPRAISSQWYEPAACCQDLEPRLQYISIGCLICREINSDLLKTLEWNITIETRQGNG